MNRTCVRYRNRTLSYFSGCDYFRLASHPQVLRAIAEGVARFGLNVAASRLTTGNHPLYGKLERKLALFFEADEAVLVPAGYLGPSVVAQTWSGSVSHALLDDAAHAALRDAVRFLDCPVTEFSHANPRALEIAVQRCGSRARLALLTDGMFSRNGTAAPLKAYQKVLPRNALILLDDAHGAGVLGPGGRGTLAHAGVGRRHIVQTITLSKAFGCYGGAILCDDRLRKRIFARSHLFAGSTPMPLPLAYAAISAVEVLQKQRSLRTRLLGNARRVKESLREAGFQIPETPGPIVALFPNSPAERDKFHAALLHAGIYPPLTKYPGGPDEGYFRFVISSEHTPAQLDRLVQVITESGPGLAADLIQRERHPAVRTEGTRRRGRNCAPSARWPRG